MRILIVPDKFKGTLRAEEVAAAMERGATKAIPDASCTLLPMSDGGEGFIRSLTSAGKTVVEMMPTGEPGVGAASAMARKRDGTYVIEMAGHAGISGMEALPDAAITASSLVTGRLIREAGRRADATSVLVGVGGTRSTDGGTGAATACGWRFLDKGGRDLPLGGGALAELQRIVPPRDSERVTVPVRGACDVDVPLVGERGSARVFAPQKGASPQQVEKLEAGLARLQERIAGDLGLDVSRLAFAGAGGGMGAGLASFFGADLRSGFDVVAEHVDLASAVARSDLVLTGEGSLDTQSLGGKVPVAVARLAATRGRPCIVIAGRVALGSDALRALGVTAAFQLRGSEDGDEAEAVTDATERALRAGSLG